MRTEPRSLEEFAEAVRAEITLQLSGSHPGVWPEIQHVEKMQGESYLGVRLDRGSGIAAPVVNVEPYYQELLNGTAFQDVMNHLIQNAGSILQNAPDLSAEHVKSYDEIKGKLIMQVISIKGNEERLADVPHREMEDMAVVCRAILGEYDRGKMSFLVTDPILQEYGISKDQLFADAAENMSQNLQYSIRPLFNVLAEMNPVFAEDPIPEPDNTLFVCTNEPGMYGAGAIAHPEFMEEAGKKLHGNFFVLPSSLHEVLLLKDDGKTDFRDLEAMVKEINATQVEPRDRLTNTVYHVDTQERIFETARHFSERQAEKTAGRGSVLKDLAENRQRTQEHRPKAHDAPARGGVAL